MAAPAGNKFWELRSRHGREKLFETPDLLREASHEYCEWCDDHPWYKKEPVKSGELAGTLIDVPTARPYTITGFLLYVGASESYWRQFKMDCRAGKHEGFLTVIEEVEAIFYTQKFEGAAVGAFNANIIARDLGLTDKSELTGKDGEALYPQPIINILTSQKPDESNKDQQG